MSYVKLEFNIDFIHQGVSCCMLNYTFMNLKSQHSRKFLDNSECKCDQEKAILDGIEARVSKIILKGICIKVHGLWGWGFVCLSVSLSIVRSAIVANVFFSNLKTHKSQIFPMAAPRGVAKISTSTKVTIFLPLVTYYFISDQYLKGDLWTTLFLRNSIVAMNL